MAKSAKNSNLLDVINLFVRLTSIMHFSKVIVVGITISFNKNSDMSQRNGHLYLEVYRNSPVNYKPTLGSVKYFITTAVTLITRTRLKITIQ